MSQTDKGVLIFGEWFEAMSNLNAGDYKSLMNAIYRYQLLGEEPPVFKGKTAIIAAMIFPCVKRRVAASRAGKMGASVRLSGYGVNPIIDEILQKRASSNASSDASGGASDDLES